MIRQIAITLMLAGIVQSAAPQQTGSIRGTVVREGTSEPIDGAKVTLGGVLMNIRQAQMTLSNEAIGESMPPEAIALARAVVAQQAAGSTPAPLPPITTITDSSGRFSFPDVPAGNVNQGPGMRDSGNG